MFRRFVCALLLLSTLWHSLAIGGQAAAFTDTHETAHAVLHSLDEAHHHTDDGSIVQDDSDESRQHIVADGCLCSPFLWAARSFALPCAETSSIAVVDERPAQPPLLAGLRRPPRLA